jgi:hypothetical protein
MGTFRRAIVPLALVIAGVVALVEGFCYHTIPVVIEKETTKKIDVPVPGPPMDEAPGPGGPSFRSGPPFGRPNVIKQTVTEIEFIPLILSEPAATRDVTVGGLVRIASGEHAGELKRTYSGDKGPALCPT